MRREELYCRSTIHYDGMLDYIRSRGVNPLPLMLRSGLNTTQSRKSDIQFERWDNLCEFYELCAQALDDSYFGLRWAQNLPKDYRNSGPTIYFGYIAKNLEHFLNLSIEYQQVHTNGIRYDFIDFKDRGELVGYTRLHPLSPPCRQFLESIVGGIAMMGQRNLPELNFLRITFQHSAPSRLDVYEETFGCPVLFNQPETTLVVERSVIKLEPSPASMAVIKPLLKTYLNWRVFRHPKRDRSISLTVAQNLPALFGTQTCNIETVAELIGLHPKKLQRLLADEGTSFRAILDETRQSLCERLLAESDISILRLARMLDYASDVPLSAACKRWFGQSPTAYRAAMRSKSSLT